MVDVGLIDITDFSGVTQVLVSLLRKTSINYDSIYVGYANSDFAYVYKSSDCEFMLFLKVNGSGDEYCYNSTTMGTHLFGHHVSHTPIVGYDPTGRPWYQESITRGFDTYGWTSLYLSEGGDVNFFTPTNVIRNNSNGEVIGVLASDFTDSTIQGFISDIDVGPNGRIFLFENDGSLMAQNMNEYEMFYDNNEGDKVKYTIVDFVDPYISHVGRIIDNNNYYSENSVIFDTYYNNFIQLLVKTRSFNSDYNNKHWTVALVLVRSDFDFGGVISLIVSIVLSLLMSFIILCIVFIILVITMNKIRSIANDMKKVAEMKLEKRKTSHNIFYEIFTIENSFAIMIHRLIEYQSFMPEFLRFDHDEERVFQQRSSGATTLSSKSSKSDISSGNMNDKLI